MGIDWTQIHEYKSAPLPPGTCEECIGEGYLYPEIWIAGVYWPDEYSETWDPHDAEAASCIACKSSGRVLT